MSYAGTTTQNIPYFDGVVVAVAGNTCSAMVNVTITGQPSLSGWYAEEYVHALSINNNTGGPLPGGGTPNANPYGVPAADLVGGSAGSD